MKLTRRTLFPENIRRICGFCSEKSVPVPLAAAGFPGEVQTVSYQKRGDSQKYFVLLWRINDTTTMKRILTALLLGILLLPASGQSIVKESVTFKSRILDRDIRYSIYLPDGYNTSERRYPALYLLHGYTDDETAWVLKGRTQEIADESIRKGESVPTIIIMPDAWDSWYINQHDGKCDYEEMFFKELIPFMEKEYRIKASRKTRAIAGLSMGGHGAFLYSLHHADMFSSCAPLSAAVFNDEFMTNSLKDQSGNNMFARLMGKNLEHWKKNCILNILTDMQKENGVRYYIDCGDDDFLLQGNLEASRLMKERRINHELRVRDGGHTWQYWRTALPEVLKFISASFGN